MSASTVKLLMQGKRLFGYATEHVLIELREVPYVTVRAIICPDITITLHGRRDSVFSPLGRVTSHFRTPFRVRTWPFPLHIPADQLDFFL